MKRLLYSLFIFSFSLVCTPSVFGQKCSDYACVIDKIKKAISDKNYRLAFEQLESAEGYTNRNVGEITDLRMRLFNAVEEEKVQAIKVRDEAKRQKERADLVASELQIQIEEVKKTKGLVEESEIKTLNEAKKTAKALAELKEANTKTALMLLKDAHNSIYRLDYNTALSQCNAVLSLGDLQEPIRDSVAHRLQEIAFFYTESAFFSDAITTLNLINQAKGFSENMPNIRQILLEKIEKIDFITYHFLQKRYFPTMVEVKGDSFTMGNNKLERTRPEHKVRVNDFKLATTETTNFQYYLFAKAAKKTMIQTPWQMLGDNPVVNITWEDAQEYTIWLSEHTQKKFRLPTEAEWEFAAKGGINHSKYSYSGSEQLNEVAWFIQNSNSKTQSVGTKKPNSMGLYDMSGNVWEWCIDSYSPDFYLQCSNKNNIDNPSNIERGLPRVLRGGAWNNNNNDYIHSTTFRYFETNSYKDNFIGFRCLSL